MTTLSAAWTIAVKDLRTLLRDRMALVLTFLLPIALVSVLGFIMSVAFGGMGGMPKVTLWIADDDSSAASRRFIEMLRQTDMLKVRPRENESPIDAAKARGMVADGETPHVLIVPRGFAKSLDAMKLPKLTLIRDPGRTMEDNVVRLSIMQVMMQSRGAELWPQFMGQVMKRSGMSDDDVAQVMIVATPMRDMLNAIAKAKVKREEKPRPDRNAPASRDSDETRQAGVPGFAAMAGLVPLENVDVQPPKRPKMLTYQLAQSVCGMTVMMLMFGLMGCSSLLLYERESGTLQRLLVAAIPRDSALWAKFLFCIMVGLAQLVVLFVYGEVVFQIGAFRDPLTLAVVSLSWLLAATSFGMLIAAWARSAKQAEGLSTLLILVMAALGGCWFPIQMMDLPLAAEIATRWTPTYWAMSAFQGLFWEQWHWTHPRMLTALAVLWAFSAVTAALSAWFFRRRYVAG